MSIIKIKFKSIASRIILSVVPLIAISTVLFIVVTYVVIYEQTDTQMNEKMVERAQVASRDIQLELIKNAGVAESLAVYARNMRPYSVYSDGFLAPVKEIVSSNKNTVGGGVWFEPYRYNNLNEYTSVYAYRAGDTTQTTEDYSNIVDFHSEPWYLAGKASDGKIVWTDVYYDPVADTTMITASRPFFDKNGNIMGVATADMALTDIQNITEQMAIGKTGAAFVVSEKGEYISYLDGSKSTEERIQEDSDTELAALGKEILSNDAGITSITLGGIQQNVYYNTLPDVNWKLVVLIHVNEIRSSALNLVLLMEFVPIIGLILAIFAILMVVRHLRRIVNKVNTFADMAASGDLSRRIEVFENDEFGVMEDRLNQMISKMSDMSKKSEDMLEAAQAANHAKSAFLSSMSHEIRTPMNGIMGFAELALDYTISPQVKDYLHKIIDNTKLLLHIINDILDISKIESGKLELEYIPFDLQPIFARCQSVILPQIREKRLDLHVYAEPVPGKRIMGDSLRIYQILMNLLSNAVKFTNEGVVRLTSTVKHTENNKAIIYFEVKDEGIGMTAEQLGKIFDPFMQADSSTTRNFGGTGLGLSITKSFVELMGSQLKVESQHGHGSTFSFEVVFDTIDAPDESTQVEIAIGERPHFNGLILVCEDNHMNQQLMCDHLSRVGLQAAIAENGKIGVEMIQERIEKGLKPFDLIFMDVFMPVMDGPEAAIKITALNTGTPIVALTANIMTSEIDRYLKSGMVDYVGKPFTTQELWRCLLKYLTPAHMDPEDTAEQLNDNEVLLIKLKKNFVKNNQMKFQEITEAIAAEDFTLAHRLVHTLKGNAGLIEKPKLRSIASDIEGALKDRKLPSEEQITFLKEKLNTVLEELEPLLADAETRPIPTVSNQGEATAVFDELEPMLKTRNPKALNMLETLQKIPGTKTLAHQIEEYDFKLAAKTLAEIRKEWGDSHEDS